MTTENPMTKPRNPRPDDRRCTATSKQTGQRCGSWRAPGQTVCRWHGAASPQAQRNARLRMAACVDPAITALTDIVTGPDAVWLELGPGVWKPVGITRADKLRAAEAVLDRTGYPRRTELDVVDARARLEARLRERLEQTEEAS